MLCLPLWQVERGRADQEPTDFKDEMQAQRRSDLVTAVELQCCLYRRTFSAACSPPPEVYPVVGFLILFHRLDDIVYFSAW